MNSAQGDLSLELLVISADPAASRLMRETLEGAGHAVTVHGPEQVDLGDEENSVRAVLVDLTTARGHLEYFTGRSPYTIALGSGDESEILQAMRSGARDYLPHPLDAAQLLEALERIPRPPRGSPAVVEYRDENGQPRSYPLESRDRLTIGRDPTNDIDFASAVVSRFHARIERTPEGYSLHDCGSRHGLLVNDRRVKGVRILEDGDRIRLGKPNAPLLVFTHLAHDSETSATAEEAPSAASRRLSNREFKDVAALLDTFVKLNSDLVLEDVLALVVDRSVEFADAERGMILLLEDELAASGARPIKGLPVPLASGRKLYLATARRSDGTLIETEHLEISQKIPEQVLSTGKGILVDDLLAKDRLPEHLATIELGVRSAMGVPLMARRPGSPPDSDPEPLGILYVDSRSRSRPFSRQLLYALESLGGEAAQAIVNARLYQLSIEKRQIDEEMRIARDIQNNLLPPKSHASDWLALEGSSSPSSEVGGDLLGYYPIDDERLGLLVGDVSGKGVAAAIFSAMLDGHFYTMTGRVRRPSELKSLVEELNRYLVKKSALTKFVTLVFGVLDRNGDFLYVNAGHNPPILMNARKEIALLKTGGTILGMFDDAAYDCETIDVAAGDTLILYSDGITEARAPDGERFTLERLQDTALRHQGASPAVIHAAILSEVESFTQNEPQSDDLTLLVVRQR